MNDQIIKRVFSRTLTIQILTALTAVLGVFVDGAVTGGCLGETAMASYGIALPLTTIFAGIASVFSTGISVLCGKTISTGDRQGANRILSQGMIAAAALGLCLLVIGFLGAEQLAALLGAKGELLNGAMDYIRGLVLCVPALIVMVALMPIMQIDGDRNRALRAIVCTTLINIVLDLTNGFVLHRGLFVMAIATTISYYTGAFVLLLHFRNPSAMFHLSPVFPRLNVVRDIISYGFPDAMQQISRSALNISLNRILLVVSGAGSVSAFSAIYSASTLCMSLGTGIGESVSVINGVLSGEKDVQSIKNLLKTALKTTLASNAALSAVMFLASPIAMRLFLSPETDAFALAVQGFRFYSLSIIVYGINVVWRAYYQSMHLVRLAYPYVIVNNFLSVALSALLLGSFFGANGVFLSFLVGETLTLVIFAAGNFANSSGMAGFNRMMRISNDFTEGIISIRSWSCANLNEIEAVSAAIGEFCREEGARPRTSFVLSLAAEEFCVNIYQYGFIDKKIHSIDVRVLRLQDGWMIRIRDDCELFDPVRYVQMHDESALDAHIGIRMMKKLVRRIEYVSALKMNNLLIVTEP